MISIKLRLNKNRRLRTGEYPVVLQVIYQRQKKIIYSPFKVMEECFDSQKEAFPFKPNGMLTKTMAQRINKWYKREKKKITEVTERLSLRGETFAITDIIAHYHMRDNSAFLSTFIDARIEKKQELGKLGIINAYKSTRASIEKFVNRKDICLSEINKCFVREYELYLRKTGLSSNTVCYYMRNFRTIYNYALEQGYISENEYPFKQVHTKACQTAKRALSREQMQKIVLLPLTAGSKMDLARDIFLFSFYSRGMSFVDIIFLKKAQIKDDIITYSRHKTNQQLLVGLTAPLINLIQKYENRSEYLFPQITETDYIKTYNQYKAALRNINRQLKKIAKMINIDIALTTYVARHTWATLAKEKKVPTAVISEGLGHASESTTRIYLKQFDHKVIDKFNKIVTNLV